MRISESEFRKVIRNEVRNMLSEQDSEDMALSRLSKAVEVEPRDIEVESMSNYEGGVEIEAILPNSVHLWIESARKEGVNITQVSPDRNGLYIVAQVK